ncbi:hypothetical protein DMC64_41590 [Amycolatopsis sp. WAC 04197]|uniref:hypothetical protein n=1 Tax=Amycolatopsis sp. WAC 04197 TaxID=2203199 RepID=UPI000F7B3738|nr:hypothetical protein [Amycolatopsis sp. WAC 04197]RSN38564.1 hypothetical protein DMC64_41590 [Amycolatopsis sp. WAC 04197]
MAGYANRVITTHFPELAEDGEDIFVVFRNPKTQTMSKLEADAVALGPDGAPDRAQATAAVNALMARLIIGGRLYDARVDGIDEAGNPLDQPLLTFPLTPESAAGLPLEVISAITDNVKSAQNPQ